MIDPGRLKTRLTILAPVETPDGQGGVARDYALQAVVWAAVAPLPSRGPAAARLDADAFGAVVRLRITLRSNVELSLQHRLRDGGNAYRIVAIRSIDDGRFNEIDAELRVE
ncbi:head-tail adaptor [Rhodopseudomonas rhenobacensis]|uniref:Head-tail adaptor n=1 Tax=Rhodopseudomonas rhenobacensis TaxID=87461 RepID=A0A7W7Z4E9_9BRAD|nr:head-tail adaptor protein [Rhodopseudomonas rhenobacensis]MBB5047827.1 head-tail adaptor [Rhodopseudomonas rhenobacensis]